MAKDNTKNFVAVLFADTVPGNLNSIFNGLDVLTYTADSSGFIHEAPELHELNWLFSLYYKKLYKHVICVKGCSEQQILMAKLHGSIDEVLKLSSKKDLELLDALSEHGQSIDPIKSSISAKIHQLEAIKNSPIGDSVDGIGEVLANSIKTLEALDADMDLIYDRMKKAIDRFRV